MSARDEQKSFRRARAQRVRKVQDDSTLISAKVLSDPNITFSQLDAAVLGLELVKKVLSLDVS